jgi:hypothetical protein
MRSSERARSLGEVFTPESEVNAMLDLLEDINYSSKFLEPGCGDGNFLIEILGRKLTMVTRLPEVTSAIRLKDYEEVEYKMTIALASIYGIDIDELNITDAKDRLSELFFEKYREFCKSDIAPEYLVKVVNKILEQNIIRGDLIKGAHEILIYDYSELPGRRIKQLVFRFSELIFPEDEVFEENEMLFGHVPQHIKDIAAVSYKVIGDFN